jgi:hypothetical protein
VTTWRNDTNVFRIVSAEWNCWLKFAKGWREAALAPRGPASSRNETHSKAVS